MFGVGPHSRSITGIVNRALVSFATDDALRREGTSGGFVTQRLIYLLDRKIIDGALVLGASDEDGKGWEEKPFIARTVDELRKSVKSKYRAVPHLRRKWKRSRAITPGGVALLRARLAKVPASQREAAQTTQVGHSALLQRYLGAVLVRRTLRNIRCSDERYLGLAV